MNIPSLQATAVVSTNSIAFVEQVFALYDARHRTGAAGTTDGSLDAIEARFLAAESSGRLAQAVRDTVLSNRQKVAPARRAA